MYSIFHTIRKIAPTLTRTENHRQLRSLFVASGLSGKRLRRVRNCKRTELKFYLFCSELKRRLKAQQKEKEKLEKDAQKKDAEPGTEKKKEAKIDESEISPNEYFKLRSAAVTELKNNPQTHPYPHKFHVSMSLDDFINKYNGLSDGEMLENEKLSVAGRVHAIRESGAKLIFYDVRGEGVKIQVMANAKLYSSEEAFSTDLEKIRRGDIIGINGYPGKTKKGELSVIPTSVS